MSVDRRTQHLVMYHQCRPHDSGSDSQRRVEPSISVNRNVTVPDGGPTPGDDAQHPRRSSLIDVPAPYSPRWDVCGTAIGVNKLPESGQAAPFRRIVVRTYVSIMQLSAPGDVVAMRRPGRRGRETLLPRIDHFVHLGATWPSASASTRRRCCLELPRRPPRRSHPRTRRWYPRPAAAPPDQD